MQKIAQTGNAVDLLVDGTFALRRALDGLARPVSWHGEGTIQLARAGRDEPPVRPDPRKAGAHAR